MTRHGRVHRVGLERGRASRGGHVDGGLDQGRHHTAAKVGRTHEEARDRPHRQVIGQRQEIARDLQAERSDFTATPIPSLSMIERMSLERAPVTALAPQGAAVRAYRAPLVPDTDPD